MKLSYYPGCSLEGTALDYDQSVRAVCATLDIELLEIADWNCCGASSAHMTDHETGMRLPIRNLLLAAEARPRSPGPLRRLFPAVEGGRQGPAGRLPVLGCRELSAPISQSSMSVPFWLGRRCSPPLPAKVTKKLGGLPIACYYGCLSLRNPRITDARNWERPETLEGIISAVGAKPVAWSHRTECCSGSLTMARPDIAEKLVGDIVRAAARAGAQAMVTDCPMCQANVESRQPAGDGAGEMPVFFATELIEAAMKGTYPVKQQKLHLVSSPVLSELFRDGTMTKEDSA